MAPCSRALLVALLLASALVQSSYGSRPSPREPHKPGVQSPVVHAGLAEPRRRDGTAEVRPSAEEEATGHRGANADGATLALLDGGGVGSEQNKGGAVVLRSKLARRILEEGATADSAARSSCRSHDTGVGCPPATLH